jgi:hypothetical protein
LTSSVWKAFPGSSMCRSSRNFPWQPPLIEFSITRIHDATREDLVFVLYQGWLFGISAVAVRNSLLSFIYSLSNIYGTSFSCWSNLFHICKCICVPS